MSPPAIDQAEASSHIEGDSAGIPYGVEGSGAESTPIEAAQFGLFHDQIQDEVRSLQDGLSVVTGAVGELSKTFGKYREIVSTVGERYGKDEVLLKKIYKLEAARDEFWDHYEKERKANEKKKLKVHRQHEEEVSTLRAQANAGKQEQEKYEELAKRLEDQQIKDQEKMDQDLKKKISQLEEENAQKIAGLEAENSGLHKDKARLEKELDERTLQRDQERETRETMQTKRRTEIQSLEKMLCTSRARYEVKEWPSHFYEDRYKSLIEGVGDMVTVYFTELPEKAVEDPVGASNRLMRNAPCFTRVPVADSECSRILRLASAQHLVFKTISDYLWQPFASLHLWKQKRETLTIQEIFASLDAHGEDIQHDWKVSTLKALGQLDDKVDVGELLDNIITKSAISGLHNLLDEEQLGPFHTDLKAVFAEAIELGRIAERDQLPVMIDTTPSTNDRAGWKEYLPEDYDMPGDAAHPSPTSPSLASDLFPTPGPLYISPKISRKTKRTGPADREEIEIIHQGVALFPDTGIFQDGMAEWKRISLAAREVARNTNGRGRTSSISMSGSGLGIAPRSPVEPSKRGSRHGTQDFD